ncbi:hypothetical protein [Arhodomonas sp. SL1]|uniref:hypothetical protein n=1 Tax=Arhodomonas sp. SL1 TaxID=3425691 RepID=UPI003F881517
MTIPKHPRLAWSQVTLDPALAKLAGVEESCALPIWSEDAGEGVPGDPVEHDTTDLLRGLSVAFGEGPEGNGKDWQQVHAALLAALAEVRGFDNADELLRSVALDFRRDGYRREAVAAVRTALRLRPESVTARCQLIIGVWFLVCDQLEPEPERGLAEVRELFEALGEGSPETARVRELTAYAYLVAHYFGEGHIDAGDPNVRRARVWIGDGPMARRIEAMQQRGYVDLGALCAPEAAH